MKTCPSSHHHRTYFRKTVEVSRIMEDWVFPSWLSSSHLHLNTSKNALRNFSLKKLYIKGLQAMEQTANTDEILIAVASASGWEISMNRMTRIII